jgi:hypothetical protein
LRTIFFLVLLACFLSCKTQVKTVIKPDPRFPIIEETSLPISASRRIDAIHSQRAVYNYELFSNLDIRHTPYVVFSPLSKFVYIEGASQGYALKDKNNTKYSVELSHETVDFIRFFNGSLTVNNKEGLFTNLVGTLNLKRRKGIGTYISGSTCVDEDNLKYRDTYPMSVILCNENMGTLIPFYHGLKGEKDGRVYINFNQAGVQKEAVNQIIQQLPELSDFVFLDNMRYFSLPWKKRSKLETAYHLGQDFTYKDTLSNSELILNSRSLSRENYLSYLELLIDSISIRGKKAVLNIAEPPYEMGSVAERKRSQRFLEIVNGHGLSFERAWSGLYSPRKVLDAINLMQTHLKTGGVVWTYPDYKKPIMSEWFAYAANGIKPEKDSEIFVMRSPYSKVPDWVDIPNRFKGDIEKTGFYTPCKKCLNSRGGIVGDWVYFKRYTSETSCIIAVNTKVEQVDLISRAIINLLASFTSLSEIDMLNIKLQLKNSIELGYEESRESIFLSTFKVQLQSGENLLISAVLPQKRI